MVKRIFILFKLWITVYLICLDKLWIKEYLICLDDLNYTDDISALLRRNPFI